MNFQKGRLYLRSRGGIWTELLYPIEEVPEDYMHFQTKRVALIKDGQVEPYFAHFHETAHQGDYVGFGEKIGFQLPLDADLLWLFENWFEIAGLTLEQWLEVIKEECPELLEEEVNRLQALIETL